MPPFPSGLAFELRYPNGDIVRLHSDGTTEGIPPGTVVINRVFHLMCALREQLSPQCDGVHSQPRHT